MSSKKQQAAAAVAADEPDEEVEAPVVKKKKEKTKSKKEEKPAASATADADDEAVEPAVVKKKKGKASAKEEPEEEVEKPKKKDKKAPAPAQDEDAAGDDEAVEPAVVKKKKKEKKEDEEDEEHAPTEEKAGSDDDLGDLSLDLSVKKKKKKKPAEAAPVADGQLPWQGTDRDYAYTELLERIFTLLRERNPNLAERKRHVMPPPQLVRVGTRKTMWTNFPQICQTMHRNSDHVMTFLLAELGTEGSIDGNGRLVIKGRFLPKQIESLLKKYIVEYVTCHMCRNPETTLTRDPVTRLYFLQCESCNSRRSVAPIKAGFHATNRTDRRKVKATTQ